MAENEADGTNDDLMRDLKNNMHDYLDDRRNHRDPSGSAAMIAHLVSQIMANDSIGPALYKQLVEAE